MRNEDVVVRLAGPDDARALVALHHACWREAYAALMTPAEIEAPFADPVTIVARRRRRLLEEDAVPTWVADHAGELVGFAAAGPPRDDDPPAPLELRALYTRAACWGRGVGRVLLHAAVGDDAAYLWVLAGNARAISFYARQGFADDGVAAEHVGHVSRRMTRSTCAPSG